MQPDGSVGGDGHGGVVLLHEVAFVDRLRRAAEAEIRGAARAVGLVKPHNDRIAVLGLLHRVHQDVLLRGGDEGRRGGQRGLGGVALRRPRSVEILIDNQSLLCYCKYG